MTIIEDRLEDVAGGPLLLPVSFTVQQVRESSDGDAIVVPIRHRFTPVDGLLTTTDLDPGPATVSIPGTGTFTILIPDSSTPVRLWPLIDAGMPAPPPSEQYAFVRNGGGVMRVQAVTEAEYATMSTPDPETLFIIIDSGVE